MIKPIKLTNGELIELEGALKVSSVRNREEEAMGEIKTKVPFFIEIIYRDDIRKDALRLNYIATQKKTAEADQQLISESLLGIKSK